MTKFDSEDVKRYVESMKKQGIRCPHCGKWVIKPKGE